MLKFLKLVCVGQTFAKTVIKRYKSNTYDGSKLFCMQLAHTRTEHCLLISKNCATAVDKKSPKYKRGHWFQFYNLLLRKRMNLAHLRLKL